DFRGHDAGVRLHFLDGVDVEIGESGTAHFRIGGVGAVEGEDGSSATLAVDRKLLREICRTVGVGHGSGGEEQKLAEVAFVKRNARNFLAGEAFAAAGLASTLRGGRCFLARNGSEIVAFGGKLKIEIAGRCGVNGEETWKGPILVADVDREFV